MKGIKVFGLQDLEAVGKFGIYDEQDQFLREGVIEGRLSSICLSKKYEGLASWEHPDFDTEVEVKGQKVGYVDSGGVLHLEVGTLREALGWSVASDILDDLPDDYDLDAEVVRLTNAIKKFDGVLSTLQYDEWSKVWMGALRKAKAYKYGSRYADGYCGCANFLWKVGVKEVLKAEHPGFMFAY